MCTWKNRLHDGNVKITDISASSITSLSNVICEGPITNGCYNWPSCDRYTGCNRRNVRDFGRVFLRSNYTDITQNTYIQSSMVTEILAREKCGLLWCLRTVLCS